MPKQFERDVSASVAGMKEALGIDGGMFGGGAIEHFRKGWAMEVFAFGKVHYWRRISIVSVRSRCGLERPAEWTAPAGHKLPSLHGGGDFPRCKRCERSTRAEGL